MLTPNMGTAGIIGSQWLNQSLNCAVNCKCAVDCPAFGPFRLTDSNANKASPMSMTELGTAYVSATATSVALAVGLNSSVGRMKALSPATQTLARRFVPFVAVVAAGAVNVGMMRYKELTWVPRCANGGVTHSARQHGHPCMATLDRRRAEEGVPGRIAGRRANGDLANGRLARPHKHADHGELGLNGICLVPTMGP
jgi:hypothetical protein